MSFRPSKRRRCLSPRRKEPSDIIYKAAVPSMDSGRDLTAANTISPLESENKGKIIAPQATTLRRPRLSHAEYTVGWVCALPIELAAARAMLDEVHEELPRFLKHDNNCYTLGRIGRHNIVIAALPCGEYGTSTAASVVSNMRHSFPNIRIGLMVGIGGGAPSTKHDVRLGDVVVSLPENGKSGVIQYDYGKTFQGKRIHNTRVLNQPPSIMRTVINVLKTDEELHGNQLRDVIETAYDRYPKLRNNYSRPDAKTDRLYRSDITHDEQLCCTNYDDASRLVERPLRTGLENEPVIHYGTIASGNQVMRDASLRDKLASEQDVLCFEMEAAGIMNELPTLVIRGISDYADTHKNDVWQRYASLSAAAYARKLLNRLPPPVTTLYPNTRSYPRIGEKLQPYQALLALRQIPYRGRQSHYRYPFTSMQKILTNCKIKALKLILI
ncbi:unnamed protein product [Clonostachys rosea]|uniref:Nucleoside phosphorylase domain-containing protein n=1 Tax=Bionectria ochroleuca TaxID=29856 RepID=A0ABY6V4H6_BIOOC|nr:unnamed protein product [Clonostachys rosea]